MDDLGLIFYVVVQWWCMRPENVILDVLTGVLAGVVSLALITLIVICGAWLLQACGTVGLLSVVLFFVSTWIMVRSIVKQKDFHPDFKNLTPSA